MADSLAPYLRSVIIATDGAAPPSELTEALSREGYELIATGSGHADVLRLVRTLKPQMLLLPVGPTFMDKHELVQEILLLRTTAIVGFMNEWNDAWGKEALSAGLFGCMVRPYNAPQPHVVLEASWHNFQTVVGLQESLELRKLMEKAKGVLMREQSITEEQAHETLLRMSQDQSIPLKALCQSIVHMKPLWETDRPKRT
jgi:AmiR/NasT family two-component response regulator